MRCRRYPIQRAQAADDQRAGSEYCSGDHQQRKQSRKPDQFENGFVDLAQRYPDHQSADGRCARAIRNPATR